MFTDWFRGAAFPRWSHTSTVRFCISARKVRRGSEVRGLTPRRSGRGCSPWWSVETRPWPSLSGGGEPHMCSWTGVSLFLLLWSVFLINTALNISTADLAVSWMSEDACCFINLCFSANESSVPLSRPPPQCGYSVQTTWRDLRLMAQYDACHVTRKVWEPCGMCCLSDSFFTVNADK